MVVRESTLKELAREFVAACFHELSETWKIGKVPGRYLAIGRDYSYSRIRELREYSNLFNYVAEDERIKEIYAHGSVHLSDSRLNKFVFGLFQRILHDSEGSLSEELLDRWVAVFAEEIFRPETIVTRLWFLENFESTEREIHLSEDLKIRYFPHWSIQDSVGRIVAPWSYWMLVHFSGNALVYTRKTSKKEIPYVLGLATEFYKLRSVLTAMRLFKSGFVDARYQLDWEMSDSAFDEPHVYELNRLGEPFSERYTLSKSETQNFVQFWELFREYSYGDEKEDSINKSRLQMAISYLESSYGAGWQKTLVDLTTCLEALLIEDEHQKPQKLGRRMSVLIGRDSEHSRRVRRDIEKMYSLRSRVVHGEAIPPKEFQEELLKLAGEDSKDTYDAGRHAIEKVRGYAREVIRRLIHITANDGVMLGGQYFAELDESFARRRFSRERP